MKKHIIFCFDGGVYSPTGVSRVLSIIANKLSENYKVTILSFKKEKPRYRMNKEISLVSLDLTFSRNSYYRKIKPILYLRKLKKILKNGKVDIIIPVGDTFNIMCVLSKPCYSKIYSWTHSSYFQPLNLQGKIFRKYFINKIDKLIVLNKTDEAQYKRMLKQINIYRIPNPIVFESNKVSKLEEKTVISVGRLSEIKGFDNLIKAFKKVNLKYPNWKLKIFGEDFGEEKKIKKLIRNLELDKNVLLMGHSENLKFEYLKSSMFVMSSKFECFPMVLLEAKEIGLPIIAFDCESGPRDLIVHERDGFLIKPENIKDMSEKIIELIKNREKRKDFGKNAKSSVIKFKMEEVIKKWEVILEE